MSTRTLNRLTATQVARLAEPGRHTDGGGLYLSVDGATRKRWVFLYQWPVGATGGKRVELGLGGARDLSLAQARTEAARLRNLIATGTDPRSERVKIKPQSFGEFADAHIEAMRPSWRNPKHADQWRMTLSVHAAPLRDLALADVGTDHVLKVLHPLWLRIPETAQRLRGRIEAVLDAAKARGLRQGENPARWRGHLDQLLPKRRKLTRGHHAAMEADEMPWFVASLRRRQAVAAFALEFTILTAARSGEVYNACWAEMDLARAVWTVPAARMKAGREHRVPLTGRAIQILHAMQGLAGGPRINPAAPVFPGHHPGKPLSSMSMSMLMRRMDREETVHGFRSTFRDWAAERTSFSHEVCEMALAHTITNKAEAAYRRGDLFDKRRELMQAWADWCGCAAEEVEEASEPVTPPADTARASAIRLIPTVGSPGGPPRRPPGPPPMRAVRASLLGETSKDNTGPQPRRRGRPPKATPAPLPVAATPAPRKRGRPPKAARAPEAAPDVTAVPKQRGRPPKASATPAAMQQAIQRQPLPALEPAHDGVQLDLFGDA